MSKLVYEIKTPLLRLAADLTRIVIQGIPTKQICGNDIDAINRFSGAIIKFVSPRASGKDSNQRIKDSERLVAAWGNYRSIYGIKLQNSQKNMTALAS